MIALERSSQDLLEIILTSLVPCEGIVKFRHSILVYIMVNHIKLSDTIIHCSTLYIQWYMLYIQWDMLYIQWYMLYIQWYMLYIQWYILYLQ